VNSKAEVAGAPEFPGFSRAELSAAWETCAALPDWLTGTLVASPLSASGSQQTARQRPRDDVVQRTGDARSATVGRHGSPGPSPVSPAHDRRHKSGPSRYRDTPFGVRCILRATPTPFGEVVGQTWCTDIFLSQGGVDVFNGG